MRVHVRVAAGMLLLAPFVLGMAQCVAFAPPATVGVRDGARLTDARAGAARVGTTVLLPTPTTVALDTGYRYRIAPDVELDGAIYAAAVGKIGFGAVHGGLRLRLADTDRFAVSVTPGIAYGHSFIGGAGTWADAVGLDYGLAASVRIAGTAARGLELGVGFRAQGVAGPTRYVDEDTGIVVHGYDSKLYLFPSAALHLHVAPMVTLAAEATWWIQYDVQDVRWAGLGVPFVGLGVEWTR